MCTLLRNERERGWEFELAFEKVTKKILKKPIRVRLKEIERDRVPEKAEKKRSRCAALQRATGKIDRQLLDLSAWFRVLQMILE